MPLFETTRGTRRELSVPRGTGWDELDRAQQKHMDLLSEQKLLFRKQGSLRGTIRRLEESDRVALAEAQFENPKAELEPNPEIEKAEKELDAVKRRTASLDDAINRAEMELVSVIEAGREAWAEEVSPQVDQAYADYAEKIDALEASRRALSYKRSLHWWLKNFSPADPKLASFKPSTGSYVIALKQRSGDPERFATVIDALRQDAVRPPEPDAPESFIPWGKAYAEAQAARTAS